MNKKHLGRLAAPFFLVTGIVENEDEKKRQRRDREVTDFDEMIEIIKKCVVCRLAFQEEECPYILPLNFGMEVENGPVILYFHGATEGKKYDLMEKNNKVSFD